MCASEFISLLRLGSLWLTSFPFVLFLSRTLGSLAPEKPPYVSIQPHRLSCTSTPPQRFPSQVTAKLSGFIRLQPRRSASCSSSLALQHVQMNLPFFPRPLARVSGALHCSGKVPLPGFGYPLSGLRKLILGDSSSPTLLGFALQSFPPSP